MRILQIHNEYKERGGEDAVVDTEQAILTAAGHEVIRFRVCNSKVDTILETRRKWYQELTNFLDKGTVDVAHLHNIYSVIGNAIYPLLKEYKIPAFQTLHNYRFLCANAVLLDNSNQVCERCAEGNFIHGIIKKCYRQSYSHSAFMAWQSHRGRGIAQQHVTKFVAVSEFVKLKHIEHGFAASQIVVKPNYVSVPDQIGPISNQCYALYMGRLSPEKGVVNLVRVFAAIGYKLKIVGDGPMKPALQQIADKAPNIEFLGHIRGEEKERLLRESSFLVVPSECFETFGMVVQEAYTYGKTVLASRIGALPFHIKEESHLFEPGSFTDLYKTVDAQIERQKLEQFALIANDHAQTALEAVTALITIYETSAGLQTGIGSPIPVLS